jgi:hypothetical protein
MNTPSRQGRWQTNTPQAPTIAVVQTLAAQSLQAAGAGTGAAPNFGAIAFGVGAPTFRAANGQLYVRFDGTAGATTLLYINTSGANTIGTTWTAVAVP